MTDLSTQESEGVSPFGYLSLVFLMVLVGAYAFLVFTGSM